MISHQYTQQKILIELEILLVKQKALTHKTTNVLTRLKNLTSKEPEAPVGFVWAKDHEKCVDCGTNGDGKYERHFANGLCQRCYSKTKAREYRRKKADNVDIVSKPKQEEAIEQSETEKNEPLLDCCAYCFMTFEKGDEKIDSEDDFDQVIFYHRDCWQEMLEKETA